MFLCYKYDVNVLTKRRLYSTVIIDFDFDIDLDLQNIQKNDQIISTAMMIKISN